MANYTKVFSSGGVPNMVREFVVDTKDQIDSIDISQLQAGSKVFVIKDSQYYMLSHARNWEPVNLTSGSGGSSSGGSGDDSYTPPNPDSDETVAYTAILYADNWDENGTYVLSVPNLTCGENGTVPPVIACTSNKEEFNLVASADADPDTDTITFQLREGAAHPTNDIELSITDIK